MPVRTWLSLIVGLVLFAGTVLWSTRQIDLPWPFTALRAVPDDDRLAFGGLIHASPGQDRAREFRDLLLESIWRDRLITITVHVALCDSSRCKVDDPNLGRGRNPAKNLYWGARYGVWRFFHDQPEWEQVHADNPRSEPYVLRRAVFLRDVRPTSAWRQRGVTERFEVCLMAVAWEGPAAGEAIRATLMDALDLRPPKEVRIGSRSLLFGSGSDLVGYVGYNAAKDDPSILPDPAEVLPKRKPRGVFFITPSSVEIIGGPVQRLGLHPVLLTTDTLTPEGYVLHGLTEALASGQIETGFAAKAAEAYAQYKRINPEDAARLFVP